MKILLIPFIASILLCSAPVQAKNGLMEEDHFVVSNGQGVSSPSFWNGLKGQNPAGMVFNQETKLQIGAGSYSGGSLGSAAFLMGNGMLGAGAEFEELIYTGGSKKGKINWGLAGRLEMIMTTLGFSSHTALQGGGTSYDAGLFIEPSRRFRLGLTLPNINASISTVATGVTYQLDESVEMIVDADYNKNASCGVLKPGLSFHTTKLQATAAYGLRFKGNVDQLLKQGFTAGFGFQLAQSLLISYEYHGVIDHRVGLTLRFN